LTHKELIDGCIRGRKTAQDALYNAYAGRLFAVCLRYTHNRMEAEDMLQEGFVKIFRNLHTMKQDSESALYPWMRRVLINLTLNYLRDQKKYRFTEDIETYAEQWVDEISEDDIEPLFKEKDPETIMNLISALPAGYRTVFNLYAFEDYSHQEIADALGISINTSKTQLFKARKAIIAGLQKNINKEIKYKLVV
jgi:RNA polymerase sigma factor (sigma-70 family)